MEIGCIWIRFLQICGAALRHGQVFLLVGYMFFAHGYVILLPELDPAAL